MCDLERYKIDLKGLTDEVTNFEWELDKSFFDALDQTEVESGALHVSLSIRKASGFFELLFHTVGSIDITCDRCLDLMEQPIETDNRLVAKIGSNNSEDDDTVTVDENEGILDTAWFTPAELPENKYYIFGKEGCKQLAEEMQVPLLAQIPLVQGICDSGDKGEPAALSSETATGLAFINLAQSVVTVVNRRNKEQPATKIVGVKS